jgi:hypothetical protein
VQTSPGTPRGTVRPDAGSTIFASMCGMTRPTVDTRRSTLSSGRVMNVTGAVSVIP